MQRVTKYDWSGVDWALPNAEISRRLGMHRETVRVARLRENIEISGLSRKQVYGGSSSSVMERRLKIQAYLKANPQATDREVTALFGICRATLWKIRKYSGILNERALQRKGTADFRLTVKEK